METAEVELWGDTGKRDTRGRRVIGEQERERLIAAYGESGLTQRAYARREGINYHTFVAWLGRDRGGAGLTAKPGAKTVRFREVEWDGGSTAAALEVRLPDGTLVRGEDPRALAALITLLRA